MTGAMDCTLPTSWLHNDEDLLDYNVDYLCCGLALHDLNKEPLMSRARPILSSIKSLISYHRYRRHIERIVK